MRQRKPSTILILITNRWKSKQAGRSGGLGFTEPGVGLNSPGNSPGSSPGNSPGGHSGSIGTRPGAVSGGGAPALATDLRGQQPNVARSDQFFESSAQFGVDLDP